MIIKIQTKRRFSVTLSIALLILSTYAMLIPNVHATEPTVQDKGLSLLSSVLNIDVAKYSVTKSAASQTAYLNILPQDDIGYELASRESKLKVLCTFVDGKLLIIHVLEASGSLEALNSEACASAVDMAKTFLGRYQAYALDAFYGELSSSLEDVAAGKNVTKKLANAELEVTAVDGDMTFKWMYAANGAIAPAKVVALGFKDGFLKYFVDTWWLYEVGCTAVKLSKSEAMAVALEAAKAYVEGLGLDAATLKAMSAFDEANVRWTTLLFDNSRDLEKPRDGNVLVLYPVWRVGIAFDKWYGQFYGLEVDIWADTGEVRRVGEAWATLPPPESALAADEASHASVLNVAVERAVLVGLLLGSAAASGALLAYLGRKRKINVLRPRVLKTGVVLLCALIASTMLFGAIATVNATTRAAIIWGSESNAAGVYPNCWRKNSTEIELQRQAAVAIRDCFANHGYTGVNHQGNLGSMKSQIFSDLAYYPYNYDYVAVVVFDHGVGAAPGYPIILAPAGEFHYMFEDNNGTKWGPRENPTDHLECGVYDMEIYQRLPFGNKVAFAFINTCLSADTSQGQGLIYGGGFPGRARGMPFAWTNRLVMSKSAPGFNVAQHISMDGYGDADSGSQVYIGFPSGSASLMQRIPYNTVTYTYCYWVVWFFVYALSQDLSVNQALDQASLLAWAQSFAGSPLRNGFTAYWWGMNPETWPSCTMAVYGNGNIHLKYYTP
ncbi:MAG: hypothetical protein QXV09_01995 [Candidatus Bathyarchaeia archaeon]